MTGDDETPRPPDEDAELRGLAAAWRASGREPPPELRERIMREAAEPSLVFLRSGEGIWLPSPNASVAIRLLYREQTDRVSTRLVQLATGHTLPAPLLEGSCLIEHQPMVAGDYHRAAAGSQHGPATTAEGCLLFRASRDLLLLPAA